MPSFNKVILAGHLTRDIELRYTTSGKPVSDMGLAVNRKFKDQEEVCFVDITVWGTQAENCSKYLSKGSAALIEGRLVFDMWEKDGKKNSKLKVIAESVQFLGGKDSQNSQSSPVPTSDEIPF